MPSLPDRLRQNRNTARWQGLAGLMIFAAMLELAPRLGLVSPDYLPPLSGMIGGVVADAQHAGFWLAVGATLWTWMLGLAISIALGTVVGTAIASSTLAIAMTRTTVEFLRPIPSVAMIPLVVLLFGTSIESVLWLVTYACVWPVLIQVLYGAQDIDPVALQTVRSYRLGALAELRYLIWPTVLPYLMTGIRLAAGIALIVTITIELVIGAPGLGNEIALAQSGAAVAAMYGYVIVTGLIGVCVNLVFRSMERRILAWHPSVRRALNP
jgi:ABC-type nitrate/sulfonate/bicarbonate transport system permease component